MAKKIDTTEILVTYAIMEGPDALRDLVYRVTTGRVWTDFDIIEVSRARDLRSWAIAAGRATRYIRVLQREYGPDLKDLPEKYRDLRPTAKALARKINRLTTVRTIQEAHELRR